MTKRNEQIKKGIAKIVRSELDRQKYEDSAWLKAFSKAKGKKDMARVNYINIRTKDLWSTEAKNIHKSEKLEYEKKISQKLSKDRKKISQKLSKDRNLYLKKGKLEFLTDKEIEKLKGDEKKKYKETKKNYIEVEKKGFGFGQSAITVEDDEKYLKTVYWNTKNKTKQFDIALEEEEEVEGEEEEEEEVEKEEEYDDEPIEKKYSNKRSKKSGFEKFLAGEESLGTSFWLYNVVYAFVITVICAYIALAAKANALLFLPLVWAIFAAIGGFRSAANYQKIQESKKQSAGWAYAARVAIIINIVSYLSQVGLYMQ